MQPGALIEVVGTRFGNGDTVELSWDGAPVSWLPATAQSDQQGTFVLSTTVATSVVPGIHELTALQLHDAGGQLQERRSASHPRRGAGRANGGSHGRPDRRPHGSADTGPHGRPTIAPSVAPTPAPTASDRNSHGWPRHRPPRWLRRDQPASRRRLVWSGAAAGTTGGSGGKVYSVATWSQLKAALLASGPRVVRLTGSADLDGGSDTVKIKNGNLTIDGSGWSGSLRRYSIVIAASNVILTQLRLRPGDQIANPADGDGLTINPGIGGSLSNMVIDRCSLLWAPDVTLAILNNVSNVTVQYSILGGGLCYSTHPEAQLPPVTRMAPM